MRRFVIGLVLGGSLVAGVNTAFGGGGIDWGQAPMEAKVGTFLYRHGVCKDSQMTPVVGSAGPAQYVCRSKFKPPPPP